MRWECNECDALNEADIDTCVLCDWKRPVILLDAIEVGGEVSTPSYLLSWDVQHAHNCTIDNGVGAIPNKGSKEIRIAKNTKVTLSAISLIKEHGKERFSDGKTWSSSIILSLPKPIIDLFEADTNTIELGKPNRVFWKVRNADAVMIDLVGDVTGATEIDLKLTETCTVHLKASNEGGFVSKVLKFELPRPEIRYFKASKLAIAVGDSLELSWAVNNAAKLLIREVSEELPKEGNAIVSPKSNTYYLLKAINKSGEATQAIAVEVEPKPTIEKLTLSNSTVIRGKSVELSWKVTDVSEIILFVNADKHVLDEKEGRKRFEVKENTTFKLLVVGLKGISRAEKLTELRVLDAVKIESFEADKTVTIQTKPVNLSWVISNATEVVILPDVGTVPTIGTVAVAPSRTTTYAIEVRNEVSSDRMTLPISVLPLPSIPKISLELPVFNIPHVHTNMYEHVERVPPKAPSKWLRFFYKILPKRKRTTKVLIFSPISMPSIYRGSTSLGLHETLAGIRHLLTVYQLDFSSMLARASKIFRKKAKFHKPTRITIDL